MVVVHRRSPSQKETVVLPEGIFPPLTTTQIVIEKGSDTLKTIHTQFVDVQQMSRIQNFGQRLSLLCPRIFFNKMQINRNSWNEERVATGLATIKIADKSNFC